jgi:hypothetical protein
MWISGFRVRDYSRVEQDFRVGHPLFWTGTAESRRTVTPMLTRKDNRPRLEQVKSGFNIVGAMLLCLAAFLLFSMSYMLLTARREGQAVLGWIFLSATAGALFVTVRYWARIFFSVVAYSALRCTVLVFLVVTGMARDTSLWSAVGRSVCLLGMTAFTYRFYDQKYFAIVDQLTLTSAVMLFFLAFLKIGTSGVNASLMPFAIALLVVAVPSLGFVKQHRQ